MAVLGFMAIGPCFAQAPSETMAGRPSRTVTKSSTSLRHPPLPIMPPSQAEIRNPQAASLKPACSLLSTRYLLMPD
ncbi:hypothetical protein THAOC_15494 [Thalassiosira oceanica]|uniref:Uncharacterized protein n=1 Tax=Thalassiosira oceanica TaxID=159749 RepID=K0SEQ8_THAOC|nr:hypothetical protein THAOC_15494 [Thalassiosira oceanica]|eukprot:EJK63830.1 hypothetical protein THAOC_15494 [Thalassiosira oceanica]